MPSATSEALTDASTASTSRSSQGGRGEVLNSGGRDSLPLARFPAPTRSSAVPLIDVQLVEERERVVERLEQILVVLDHLAAHVDTKPLLVDVQLEAMEHVSEWHVRRSDQSR